MTVTLKPADLIRVLSNAALFAGKDDTLPVLTCVQLRAADGAVRTAATDRYRLGTDKAPAEVTEPLTVLLHTADIAAIIRLVKPSAKGNWSMVTLDGMVETVPDVTVEAGKGGTREVVTRLTVVDVMSGSSMTVTPYDGAFPNTDPLIPDIDRFAADAAADLEHGVPRELTLNFAYLAMIGKIVAGNGDRSMRMRWTTRPNGDKPGRKAGLVRIDVGDTFVGAIMPVDRDYDE